MDSSSLPYNYFNGWYYNTDLVLDVFDCKLNNITNESDMQMIFTIVDSILDKYNAKKKSKTNIICNLDKHIYGKYLTPKPVNIYFNFNHNFNWKYCDKMSRNESIFGVHMAVINENGFYRLPTKLDINAEIDIKYCFVSAKLICDCLQMQSYFNRNIGYNNTSIYFV